MFNFSEQLSNLYTSVVENLTDSHKATIIWNNKDADLDTKKKLLMCIAMMTDDSKLKEEILNRIAIEESKYICFKTLDESSVYVIVDVTEQKHYIYGVFTSYDAARHELESMLADNIKFNIEKRTLYDDDRGEFEEDATMVLNARGDIMAIIYTKDCEDTSDGFEDQFIDVPFDLKRGTIVKCSSHDGYYVLAHDFESIRDIYHERKENPDKYLSTMDFSNNQIRGLNPLKDGTWYHYHLNIFDISPCTEEDLAEIDGDEEHNALMRALKAAREYFTNTENDNEWNSLADSVLAASKEYAKICFGKNDHCNFDKYLINTKEIKVIDDFMY